MSFTVNLDSNVHISSQLRMQKPLRKYISFHIAVDVFVDWIQLH